LNYYERLDFFWVCGIYEPALVGERTFKFQGQQGKEERFMNTRGMMTDSQRGEIVAIMVEAIPDLTFEEASAILFRGGLVVQMRAILDRIRILVVNSRKGDEANEWRKKIVAQMVQAMPDLTSLEAEKIISNEEIFVAAIRDGFTALLEASRREWVRP
jgi:hypothetical protein